MEAGGPSTPTKSSRMIPSESDAIKGENIVLNLVTGIVLEEQHVELAVHNAMMVKT